MSPKTRSETFSKYAALHMPGDDSEDRDECNETIAGVAKVRGELSEFLDAIEASRAI